MILFYDTETSGLPHFREPSDDPRQPHLLELAMSLTDMAGNEIDRFDSIVDPGPGCFIEPEAFAAHGISLERARDEGMCPIEAGNRFLDMVAKATLIVGHNVSFDVRIMRIHSARHFGIKWEAPAPLFCTMKRSQNIIMLPPTAKMVASGRNWPKPPNLGECIEHFFGEKLDGAHDALIDVRASIRVFNHLTRTLGVAA